MKLKGKVAIVSGASQGIGRGLALSLAKEGANIVVSARTKSKLDEVCLEIEKLGSKAIAVECDVSNIEDITNVVETAIKEFGRIDILANLAQGAMAYRTLLEADTDYLKLAYATGPLASYEFMKLCFPYMKENGGKIINTCSAAGMGAEGFGAYAMAKEAIRALTRTAAKEWGKYKINVNCFMPLAKGEGWAEANDPTTGMSMEEMVTASVPLGYLATPDEVGATVKFLAMPDSDYITGMTFAVDGGQYMII